MNCITVKQYFWQLANTTNVINADSLPLNNKNNVLGGRFIFMEVLYFHTFADTLIQLSPLTHLEKSCIGSSIFIKLSTKKYKIKSKISYNRNLVI
ncbi:MAG: hypothetical protein ACKO9I_18565 [Sphaerospermopsis kisseleviana]